MTSSDAKPTSTIRNKIGSGIRMQDVFTKERMQECESIIEKAHEDFFKDVIEIWGSILVNFMSLSANPEKSPAIVKQIAADSLAIRGKLDEVGYGLGMKVSKSLYDFASNDKNPQFNDHVLIYSKHIDVMNTIIKYNLKGDGGVMGQEMMQALNALIKKLN